MVDGTSVVNSPGVDLRAISLAEVVGIVAPPALLGGADLLDGVAHRSSSRRT
ncbi:MAG: hypothetical protein ACTHLT_18965 [Devosia sp.]